MTTTISNSILSATINAKGAELISLKNKSTGREYIWEGNPEYWGKHAPILFPIVGTLKNNSYQHHKQTYTLTRHGFARDYKFEKIEHQENKVVFSLQENIESLRHYPFKFELQIAFTLHQNELVMTYTIKNNSPETMPFSIGGHPAFALKKEFENYSLHFEKEENLLSYALQNDLLTENITTIKLNNKSLPLSYSLFENDALVFKKLQSKQIQVWENSIPMLNFKFHDFPNFGIWTKVGAPFICLEPWLGYADTVAATGNLMEKEGITLLETNSKKEFSFSVEIT